MEIKFLPDVVELYKFEAKHWWSLWCFILKSVFFFQFLLVFSRKNLTILHPSYIVHVHCLEFCCNVKFYWSICNMHTDFSPLCHAFGPRNSLDVSTKTGFINTAASDMGCRLLLLLECPEFPTVAAIFEIWYSDNTPQSTRHSLASTLMNYDIWVPTLQDVVWMKWQNNRPVYNS